MKNIILDTNFLLIPLKFRVDIFSELNRLCDFNYKLCVFDGTIDELRKIMSLQKGIDKKAAQFGLKLISLKNIEILKSKETDVDSAILENLDENTVVATLDINLKKKLLKKKIPVIILRQKEYLKFG